MFKKYKIRNSIITIVLFLSIMAPLYCFDRYVTKHVEEEVITSLKDISDQNAKLIENEINNKFDLLGNLAKEFSDYTEEEFSKSVNETSTISNRFNFREIGIALPNGIAYMSSNTIFDISEREYFKRSISGENHVSETLKDMEDKTDINVYSVPIFNLKNEVSAVFLSVYDTNDFLKLLQVDTFAGNGYSYILNQKGEILAITQKGFEGEKNFFDRLRNSSTTSRYKNINNKAINEVKNMLNSNAKEGDTKYWYDAYKYAVYKKLDINDWWLVTVVPEDILIKRTATINRVVHFMCVIVFLLASFVVFYNKNKGKKSKLYLQEVAYKDSFTGLYNKNYLKEKISNKHVKKIGYKKALILFNINNFKIINEIYGLNAGDYIIKNLGKILDENKVFKEEIVARNSGDEFLSLFFYENNDALEERLHKIENKIRKISYNENNIFVKLYIGIYEMDNLKKDFEKMYNYANIAKNKSKSSNSGFFTYYNEDLAQDDIKEKTLENEIKEAIANKEFKAWFQPKFDCKTKEIVGCEALVRWYRQDGQIYFPNTFIDISERNGLIKEIDKLVLEDVCIKVNEWRKLGLKCMPVSVNISRIYLDNMDIIGDLNEIIAKYNISSNYIQLEITESSLVRNEDVLNKIINEMHKYGFKVLLDDFGVGYSSLHSINKLNFDTLKIDKSFVDAIGINNGNCVLKHVIDLGKILDMEIVAEGVETKDQYEFLKENGCDTIQGYYFSKPLDSKSFQKLLKI